MTSLIDSHDYLAEDISASDHDPEVWNKSERSKTHVLGHINYVTLKFGWIQTESR